MSKSTHGVSPLVSVVYIMEQRELRNIYVHYVERNYINIYTSSQERVSQRQI